MKLRINEVLDMSKKDARKYALDIMNIAVDVVNSKLDCNNEMMAKVYKEGPTKLQLNVGSASGSIIPLSTFIFNLSRKRKIVKDFYINTKENYGNVYYEVGYGSGNTTFGGGFNGTYQTINTLDELREFVLDEAVPKIINDINKAYELYISRKV